MMPSFTSFHDLGALGLESQLHLVSPASRPKRVSAVSKGTKTRLSDPGRASWPRSSITPITVTGSVPM